MQVFGNTLYTKGNILKCDTVIKSATSCFFFHHNFSIIRRWGKVNVELSQIFMELSQFTTVGFWLLVNVINNELPSTMNIMNRDLKIALSKNQVQKKNNGMYEIFN